MGIIIFLKNVPNSRKKKKKIKKYMTTPKIVFTSKSGIDWKYHQSSKQSMHIPAPLLINLALKPLGFFSWLFYRIISNMMAKRNTVTPNRNTQENIFPYNPLLLSQVCACSNWFYALMIQLFLLCILANILLWSIKNDILRWAGRYKLIYHRNI